LRVCKGRVGGDGGGGGQDGRLAGQVAGEAPSLLPSVTHIAARPKYGKGKPEAVGREFGRAAMCVRG
jgi:hypothetical protein